MRATFIPSNFETLDGETKSRYLDAMKPFLLIESLSENAPCS